MSSLVRQVNALGAVALCAYAGLTLLSYVQAPALWQRAEAPRAAAFFESFERQAGALPWLATPYQATADLLRTKSGLIVSFSVPYAVATVALIALMVLLVRQRERADGAVAAWVLRWSIVFAAVCALAMPVFTQDFWLSMAWGRMIAAAVNPYHAYFTPDSLAGLPLDHTPMIMSYGPLWAVVSGVIVAAAGGSVLAAAVLFKLVLAAAWIGALVLLRALMRPRPPGEQCLALAVFGWTPAGVTQALAEGHNDIAMAVLALAWLALLVRGARTAPVVLMASALCKYVTAPLFVLDWLYCVRAHHASWRTLAGRYVAPALLAALVFALFYRSPQFFDGLRTISQWRFLQPSHAVAGLGDLTGIPLAALAFAVAAIFPIVAVWRLFALYRAPTSDNLFKAAVAILAVVSFTAVSHFWPWYVIWLLPFAALLPSWWLAQFIVGVAVALPFAAVVWWVAPFAHHMELTAIAVYGFAVLWLLAVRAILRHPAASG